MSKMTLIDLVQDIMNDLSSDSVNSITDTEESMQIAQILKSVFFELIGQRDVWPHLSKFTTLNSVGDSTKPTHLGTPDNLKRLDWFKYNKKKVGDTRNYYSEIKWKEPSDFIEYTNQRNLDNTNVIEVTDYDGAKFQVLNDRQPTYYTSFDDNFLVLDSYDSDIESSLQGSNTQVKIYLIPTWTVDDNFTPDLPAEAFPGYLAEAKSVCSFRLEEIVDEKAEQQSKRQRERLSRSGWQVHGGIKYPNYGRNVGRRTSTKLFDKES